MDLELLIRELGSLLPDTDATRAEGAGEGLEAGFDGKLMISQVFEVSNQIKDMRDDLIASSRTAMLIIVTDSEATDSNLLSAFRLLEGLPLQIIVQICTEKKDVFEYWQNINSVLNLDIFLLNTYENEAKYANCRNNWLTYGRPIHHMRGFGVVFGVDSFHGQVSKDNIRKICKLLL